jgi:Zinc dependent phospholipase C
MHPQLRPSILRAIRGHSNLSVPTLVGAAVLIAALTPQPASAYSVLAHEALIDAMWESRIAPLVKRRFKQTSTDDLRKARAFAYGGAVIQDLGYYPFGSKQFTNLVHYVRSGDFVEALIREAADANEYAFALGALAHYAADNAGHPEAINRAVPLEYPKLRARYGEEVTYEQSPTRHVLVEFAFDVVQAAAGAYTPDHFHSAIGFEVAKPVLERAFCETYGLEMKDLFLDMDLAIGTYRFALGKAVPHITQVAWDTKRREIERITPGIERTAFVFTLSRQDYEREYGTRYRKPGLLVRIVGFLYRLVPRIGPFRVLSFKAPSLAAEQLFVESFKDARAIFRESLESVAAGRLDLPNTNFDTGRPPVRGEYSLADDTYARLLHELAERRFAGMPDALSADIVRYFAGSAGPDAEKAPRRDASHSRRSDRKREERIRRDLALLAQVSRSDR